MAYISQLASKQIEYLFNDTPKSRFEKRILKEIVFENFQQRGSFALCSKIEIEILLQRITQYQLSIIGIHTDIEDELPLYTFNIEDYSSKTTPINSNWVNVALEDLLRENKKVLLRFYINISVEQIEILMLKTGIPFI